MAYTVKLHDKYSELHLTLQKNLPKSSVWFIKFLVLFMTSSIKVGSINFGKLGLGMDNKATKWSNIRMIEQYV